MGRSHPCFIFLNSKKKKIKKIIIVFQVEMQSMGSKTRYVFPCKRWLAEDEDDKETVRELPATGPGIKKPLPGQNQCKACWHLLSCLAFVF